MRSINALAPAGSNAIYATDGSAAHDVDQWVWDLDGARLLGTGTAAGFEFQGCCRIRLRPRYAFGASAMDSSALISESWRHRLIAVGPDGTSKVVLSNLPVYPSRLSPASGGGWWLTAFIARTQLVEFVLREPAYRKRMMAEINPEYWVAPRLRSGKSFKKRCRARI